MAVFGVSHLDEIEDVGDGECEFRPVRVHFGIMAFGVSAMTARATGDRLIKEHDETQPGAGEELYVITSGHARFELDGETREAPVGTFVHVPPGVKRTAFAEEAGTTVLVVGAGAPGERYEPSGWDLFAPLFPLFAAGEYERGADLAQALIADDPPYGGVYYNTACFESRAGRIDAGVAHLRRALELTPSLVDLARGDEDLDALREHPEFAQILGS
jgi:mannose-6-phosphate isomerase-like protein (cupin superfamily)